MILTRAQQAQVAKLAERYGVTQETVARAMTGKGRSRSGKRVDRSLISKVWRGHASSAFVMRETYAALVVSGWPKPEKPPRWAHIEP